MNIKQTRRNGGVADHSRPPSHVHPKETGETADHNKNHLVAATTAKWTDLNNILEIPKDGKR